MRFLRNVASGAKAGLLAGAVVAVFYLVTDVIQLQPLATPTSLASGLVGGGSEATPAPGVIDSLAAGGALVLLLGAYTLLHLLVFAGVGVVGAFVLGTSSFWRALWTGAFFGGVTSTGLLYVGRWLVEFPVAVETLGLPSVLLANAMAGTVLGLVLHVERLDGDPLTVPAKGD